MTKLVEIARAKINLGLRILGRRPDGYHELESLVAFGDVGDRITLRTGDPASPAALRVTVTGPYAHEIVGANLVATALEAVETASAAALPLAVELDKVLPVASGIGGGSADAAAVLRAIRSARPDLSRVVDWPALAQRLGADVPVCLADRPAFMTGIGEQVVPLRLPRLDAVLANPRAPVPVDKSRRVFAALAAPPLPPTPERRLPPPLMRAADVIEYVSRVGNDLERPAATLVPELAAVKAALAGEPGCGVAVLSGAGPTMVGLFGDQGGARAAAAALAARHPSWWVRATVLGEA